MAEPSVTADVVVVGGGIAGCAAAFALAQAGLVVRLLERDALATRASGAAAGMLAPIGEAAPGSALQRLGLAALERFEPLCGELRIRSGIDPEYERCGALHVASDAAAARALRARAAALGRAHASWIDAREAAVLQPGLAPGIEGALWVPREAHVRSPQLALAFAGAARASGARIETGRPVVGLEVARGRVRGVRTPLRTIHCAAVVVCTGSWFHEIAGWLPEPAGGGRPGAAAARLGRLSQQVEPVRGQIVSLDQPQPPLQRMLWGPGAYLVPKRDGSVVVGATEERVGFDARVTAGGVGALLAAAPRLLPGLAQSGFRRAWAGLRPATPDGLPLVGRVGGLDGLVIAVGHSRNGVLLSPLTGEWVRELVTGKRLEPAVAAALDPERFEARGAEGAPGP